MGLCEDCGKKSANYGLQDDKKRRWCAECAKQHRGVQMGKKTPAWGGAQGKRRRAAPDPASESSEDI